MDLLDKKKCPMVCESIHGYCYRRVRAKLGREKVQKHAFTTNAETWLILLPLLGPSTSLSQTSETASKDQTRINKVHEHPVSKLLEPDVHTHTPATLRLPLLLLLVLLLLLRQRRLVTLSRYEL